MVDYAREFCLNEAAWYTLKRDEALRASFTDPEAYYQKSVQKACLLLISMSHQFPRIRNQWYSRAVPLLNRLKGLIGVGSKLCQNINQFSNLGWILNKLTDAVRTRV